MPRSSARTRNSPLISRKVGRFLRDRGVTDFAVAPVQFREITARAKDDDGETVQRRVGFRLIQRIEVSSGEVETVPRLGTDSSATLLARASRSSPTALSSSTPSPARPRSR